MAAAARANGLMAGGQGGDASALIRSADALLRQRRAAEAIGTIEALLAAHPARVEGPMLLSRARQMLGDFHGMLAAAREARRLDPAGMLAGFLEVEALLHAGEVGEARDRLAALERAAGEDPQAWRRIVEVHTHLGQHEAAERGARRLASLRPGDPEAHYLLSSALIAVGRLDEAEALLDGLVRLRPGDGDAWYNRATLRRQAPGSNHVAALREALAVAGSGPARIPLDYALAKELDDLGEYEESFAHLEAGASQRRRLLSYRVENDERAMAQVMATFDEAWARRTAPGDAAPGPILVVGLPRSGTTLVERILGQHGAVASVGEVNDLALAVMRAAGPSPDKSRLIERAAAADPAALGRGYWHAIRGYGHDAPYVIDKTPLNFLYLGLVRRALPGARIIHLRRHPMASGYAMYRTLFRMGYPFSYDLADLGRYLVAYHRLMAHWRMVFPGEFLDVDYEALVDDQEGTTRRLLEFCGLPWEDACLRFHEDPRPSATASAAQVRQPLYRHARDHWRHYERALQPLASHLRQAGIDLP